MLVRVVAHPGKMDSDDRRIARPQMRLIPCCNCNPFRSVAVRTGCVLSAWVLVIVVGVVVYRNSLSSKRQEFQLKCDNRKEIFTSEVDNNLGASFVILGLVASFPYLDQEVWLAFTQQTVFLRPHVLSLAYCLRVLADQRAAVEKEYNTTFYTYGPGGIKVPRGYDSEYTPVIYQSANISSFMMDTSGYPFLKSSILLARDTGDFALSAPYLQMGSWRMGSFLPYYGDHDPLNLTVDARRFYCLGYVVTVLNVEEVFGAVMSRFNDDLVVSAVTYVDPTLDLNTYYNCSSTANPCEVYFYGGKMGAKSPNTVVTPFTYGSQTFELRCSYAGNVRLQVLRSIIAWPLLMTAVVVFCTVAVYLVLKRMSTVEKDVNLMEIMNENLRAAKSNAEAADTAKSSFLATVSHEIRTPMNGVIGMTNLLMGTDLSPQQLEYVKIAQASGNALVALISDVLDLSKIEAGRMEIETVPFDMREEVDSILSLFEEKVQQKKLEVSALVHDSVPPWLYGDPGRFRQVLINLIGNAIKFTKQGSIFLCIRLVDTAAVESISPGSSQPLVEIVDSTDQIVEIPMYPLDSLSDMENEAPENQYAAIHVDRFGDSGQYAIIESSSRWRCLQMAPPRLSMRSGRSSSKGRVAKWRAWKPTCGLDLDEVTIVVSIEDTGIGISKHMQSQLFEPFVQADSSTSREYGGTGIGLSICQKLVRLSKGDITVNSVPGEGSVFKFSIVLPTSGPCGHLEKLSVSMKRQPSDLEEERIRGIRVLLVDANPVRQEVAATYLRRVGAMIDYVEDVDSALKLLTRNYQAVIVDLQGLNHKDALHLVRRMQDPNIEKVPVLALSIPLDSAVQNELQEAGIMHMVHKPLRCTTLIAGLLQALGVQVTSSSRKANTNAKLLSGKRLLVVDDNMVNRRVASSMLQRYGATVVTVNGGVEALNAVRKQEPDKTIDLILMDIQMPEMDGYEATRCIRRLEVDNCEQCCDFENLGTIHEEVRVCPHHRIPIVAVTADVMKGTHELCFSAGMDDYIPKPLDQKQLQLLLERFLKNKLVNAPGSP